MIALRLCRKPLTALVAASFLLAACATTPTTHPDGTPLTPEEARLRERNASYNQTIAEGALIGCAVGALIGAFVVSSGKNRGSSAAIGCGAGAVVGAGAGVALAESKEGYAQKEDQKSTLIADAKKTNESLAADISDARTVIANDRARIDKIDKELASGTITKQQATAQMQRVDENIQVMTASIDALKKKHNEYAKTAQGNDPAMKQEIATLQKQIAQMEDEVNSLVRRRQVSRVG